MYYLRHGVVLLMGAICLLGLPFTTQARTANVFHQVHTSQPQIDSQQRIKNDSVHRTHITGPKVPSIKLSTYTVQPSDTLWEIAHVSGLSISALQQINSMQNTTIYAGERLQVPQKWQAYAKTRTSTQPNATRSAGDASPSRDIANTTASIPGVPSNLIPLYKAAGNRYGIPWTVLAAIHKTETDFAVSNCPVSSEGAMGPMQFLPSTFAAYGVAAPGHHGRPDIHDVSDAVYTAAHMLAMDGFSSNPAGAIYAYNHSTAYVKRIMALARL
jgi:LysM repeat protein